MPCSGVGADPGSGALVRVAVPGSGAQGQQEMVAAWVSRRKYFVLGESVCVKHERDLVGFSAREWLAVTWKLRDLGSCRSARQHCHHLSPLFR